MSSTLPDLESLLLYDGFVRALARSLVRGEDAVDDIVQQTWLRALRRPLGLLGSPRAWLATVVRSVVIDKRRTDAHRAQRERAAATSTPLAPSAAEILGQEEWRRRIVDAVLDLAEPYRTT